MAQKHKRYKISSRTFNKNFLVFVLLVVRGKIHYQKKDEEKKLGDYLVFGFQLVWLSSLVSYWEVRTDFIYNKINGSLFFFFFFQNKFSTFWNEAIYIFKWRQCNEYISRHISISMQLDYFS